ncbi:MAG: hypothetical protein M1835_001255 [Candelina submexicana]|nr:MAG: hypothetical protein M1835_001255 [Candelina submexicana]
MPPQSLPAAGCPMKRLIIACDGTWLNADSGFEDATPLIPFDANDRIPVPSNVTRICRATKAISSDGTAQIVYYQAGLGSGMGISNRVLGGSLGQGLSDHIREAYDFMVNNYVDGDEIYLLGFSRGAFTARSVAALIGTLGLLTKEGMTDFQVIFKDYQNSWDDDYRSPYPNTPFPHKPNAKDPAYKRELVRIGLSRADIPIKAIGVWDTVGSLGVPRTGVLEALGPSKRSKEYSFSNTKVGMHIENAFQALALDEEREPFSPSVWELPRGSSTYLKQCWFPGVHSNIGGGYDDQEIANITLAWMMSQLSPFLDFNRAYLFREDDLNKQYYIDDGQRPRPWSFGQSQTPFSHILMLPPLNLPERSLRATNDPTGKIYKSAGGAFSLSGTLVRTPGDYRRLDPYTGRPTHRHLHDTHEFIHASVRCRIGLRGPGIDDKGDYDPEALDGWENARPNASGTEGNGDVKQKQVLWEYFGKHGNLKMELPEDKLGEIERELLMGSPDIYDKVLGIRRRGARARGEETRERIVVEKRIEYKS